MNNNQRFFDDMALLRSTREWSQSITWASMPGYIVDFDPVAVTATVQIAIAGMITSDEGVTATPYPLLVDVPIIFPRGGGCTLTFPVAKDDECLIFFASRAIDSWLQSGPGQPPNSMRRVDLSDAFAMVGPMSNPRVIRNISTSATQLRSDDGSTFVELDPKGQVLRFSAPGGFVFDGPKAHFTGGIHADQDVVAGSISLQNHVHPGVKSGDGNTGGPSG